MIRDVIVAAVAALIVNELTDLSPWTAIRVARWAAGKIYADNPERAEKRAEEWEALISGESIPTKISKLLFGLGLGCFGLWCVLVGYVPTAASAVGRAIRSAAWWTYEHVAELLAMVTSFQLANGPECHQPVAHWLEGTGIMAGVTAGWLLFGAVVMGVAWTFKVAFRAAAGIVRHRREIAR